MKTTRWGILGTGSIAGKFAEALGEIPDARLAAVGSRSREGADAFARAFGVPRAHASYEDLVRDPEIDVVYVATPNTSHRDHAVLALENGKAVLCEKPFTVNAAEARAVVQAARRAGRFCMEGMWMRFVPLVRELVELVRGGAIGDLRTVTASLGFPYVFEPGHRVFNPALGGGAMLDLGVYALSFAFHLLGLPTSMETQAVLGATGVDEQASVLLRFQGDRQATIGTSLRTRLGNDAALFGTQGMIRVREPLYCPESATLVRAPQSPPLGPQAPRRTRFAAARHNPLVRDLYARLSRARSETSITRRPTGNGYAHEAIEVMRCLEAGERESPIMSLDESVAIMDTLDALAAQWRAGPARQGTEGAGSTGGTARTPRTQKKKGA
jgi:predicted dehydrogenase